MPKDKTEIVYGLHAVRYVIEQSPETILDFWIRASSRSSAVKQLITMAESKSLLLQQVPRATLDKLADGHRHQDVIVRRQKSTVKKGADLQSLLKNLDNKSALFLILDGVQDPHNLGACLRTADATGVTAVIIPRDHSAGITASVRKVASGAAETVDIIYVANLARAMRQLQEAGIWLVGATGEAGESLFDVDLAVPLAFVMGGEGKGLRHNTKNHCDRLVSIPMQGRIESLNLSVATGICLYEAIRQRNR
jgi:23S rRNA (guanosine2251-2'-O)-methyltransferase